MYIGWKQKAEGNQEDAKQCNQIFDVENIFLRLTYYLMLL